MGWNRRQFLGLAGLGALGTIGAGYWSQRGRELPLPANPAVAQAPSDGDDLVLRFAVTADGGAADANQRLVGQAMADWQGRYPYDLVLMAGDNIYNSGELSKIKEAFETPYAELLKRGVKFRAALGNHDIRTDHGDRQVEYAPFNMGGRYYTFSQQNCQFFALETNVDVDWKAQLAWLERELAASQATVKIVYGHHPVYASGHYGTDQAMVARLAPLFKKYGVQLYINGHEHHYERTQSIDGTTYLITGNGGAHLRPVGKSPFTEFAVSRYGFSLLEVRKTKIVIQGIDLNGEVVDRGEVALTV
jgi:3',5'-cyclic AMP phosphodiesterase CpdA